MGGATEAEVDIELGVGTLRLAGGTLAGAGSPMQGQELLRGEFVFAHAALAPEVDYDVAGKRGRLKIGQGGAESASWPWDDQRNEWSLFLNPVVPTDLRVEVGAGDSDLSLGGLSLTDLQVTTGAGDTTLDFAGDWRTSLDAAISSGAGDLTLRVPESVGVRVEVMQGLGEVDFDGLVASEGAYINAAYGAVPVTIELTIDQGAGNVTLKSVG